MWTLILGLLFAFFINIQADCPANSSVWQSQCFIFYNTPSRFDAAEVACAQINGHLVSIHDGFTNSFLTQEAKKNLNTADFWIGALKDERDPQWSWTDGSNFDFLDWNAATIPDFNCGALSIADGLWATQNCSIPRPFACQIDGNSNVTLPPSSPCDDDAWNYYPATNACYKLYNNSDVEQWQGAEDVCVQNGAHLVSLHSQEEALFLMSTEDILGYALWMGLTTHDQGYTWIWSDGSPTDYMPWRTDFPYLLFGYDSCGLLMTDNGIPVYENLECSFSQPFFCKKQL